MSTLTLSGLGKSYRGVAALDDFSLQVPSGSRAAVVGASGSGKTTLLRLIAGFERPDRGRIELDGAVLADAEGAMPVHRRGIGIVAQDGALFPHLSLADNIGFGLNRRAPDRDRIVAGLMETVELDRSWRDKRPHELSGGQQQRVALARALALRPRLMLLDEPFSALDAGLRESTRRAVAAVLAGAGVTTVLVTHDQSEALSFADQVAVLRAGRLVQAGSPRDLYCRPADPGVAALLGDALTLPADLRDGCAFCALGCIRIDTAASGPATIMLRPEQLHLDAGPGDWAAVPGCLLAIEFGGGACLATVRLDGAGAGEPALTFRVRTPDLPPVGSAVSLSVTGPAHVFAVDRQA